MKPYTFLLSVLLGLSSTLAQAQTISQTLTVSAAASMADALKEIAPRFESINPKLALRFNFGASGVLLQQINQGAPVDLFISADQETMNRAATMQLIDVPTRKDLATNVLVLVEPVLTTGTLRALQDLNSPAIKRIAIGKPATVPAGHYTQQVLEAAKLWQVLTPKVVFADNVRQTLDYVARGEVDAGFVYRTDASLFAGKVRVALTPQPQPAISYPMATIQASKQKEAVAMFATYLLSASAQQVLAKYGFGAP